jgi:hypothetical protein
MMQDLHARALDMAEQVLASHGARVRFADPRRAAFLMVSTVDGVVNAMAAQGPAAMADPAIADEVTAMVLAFLEAPSPAERRAESSRQLSGEAAMGGGARV